MRRWIVRASSGRDELWTMSEWGKLVTTDETKIQSAIKLIAELWSAQTYAVALTWGKDSLFFVTVIYKGF